MERPGLTGNRYVDGEIVREGVYGDQGDGAYSAGVSTCPGVFQDLDPPTIHYRTHIY